jgi:hypothetical protein
VRVFTWGETFWLSAAFLSPKTSSPNSLTKLLPTLLRRQNANFNPVLGLFWAF